MNHIQFSCRNLLKNKAITFVGILSLSIAFCCFVLSVIWIRFETGYDGWHTHSDRIYRILNKTQAGYSGVVDAPLSQRLKDLFPEIEEATTVLWWHFEKITLEDMILENCYETDSCFFRIFNTQFIAGNSYSPLSDNSQIVLTQSVAVSLFGSAQDAIGKTLKGNDSDFFVSAVIQDFTHSNLSFKALVKLRPSGWRNSSYLCFCKLKENADKVMFAKKLEV